MLNETSQNKRTGVHESIYINFSQTTYRRRNYSGSIQRVSVSMENMAIAESMATEHT